MRGTRGEIKTEARLAQLLIDALLQPHLVVICRFDTRLRLKFMIAVHVSQHCRGKHVALVHVVDHAAITLVDLIDHATDGSLLLGACMRCGHSFDSKDGRGVLGFEGLGHFEYTHMLSRFGSLHARPICRVLLLSWTQCVTITAYAKRCPVVDSAVVV